MWKNKLFLAASLPFLALILWTASVALTHSSGTSYRVRIVGYDPFDLISGHYIRFRYDFGAATICAKAEPKKSCVCLVPDAEGFLLASRTEDCSTAGAECPLFVRGECKDNGFLADAQRFYIPEEYAPVLVTLPPESSAEIKLDSSGILSIQNIFVKSQPIFEYAKMRLEGAKP